MELYAQVRRSVFVEGLDAGHLESAVLYEWTEVFGSERLTGALLDRLTHHVHILEMNGESFRLIQSKKKRAHFLG